MFYLFPFVQDMQNLSQLKKKFIQLLQVQEKCIIVYIQFFIVKRETNCCIIFVLNTKSWLPKSAFWFLFVIYSSNVVSKYHLA